MMVCCGADLFDIVSEQIDVFLDVEHPSVGSSGVDDDEVDALYSVLLQGL